MRGKITRPPPFPEIYFICFLCNIVISILYNCVVHFKFKEVYMEPGKMEILKGNALFVLENLAPMSVLEITLVWSIYSTEFAAALRASNSRINYGLFFCPSWRTSDEEVAFLRITLLEEGLVDDITEIVKGMGITSLKINKKGLDYLKSLTNNGLRFKGRKKLKEIRPEVIRCRKHKIEREL